MKLRNKKTGEIREIKNILVDGMFTVNSLAELNEEWEDVPEEPKDFQYIMADGNIDLQADNNSIFSNNLKEIGNYFETEEEAEKAVEKLKAWKRLKDKGVELYGWRKNPTGTYDFLARWKDIPPKMTDIINDLDLLFGGEE